jgi:glycosyltransferase involved in cell wall biosynthesis
MAREMNNPTVSVVLPTYNRAELLPRAIESVIGQTYHDWEIVLVDDGSTDATPDLVRAYARRLGDRLNYIRQDNGGSSRARNRGIEAARGRYVAFLDSDDEFLPTKLARQIELFDLRPELGLVYCDYSFVDLDGVYHASTYDEVHPTAREVETEAVAPGLLACRGDLFGLLIRAYFISTIVGMVRREVLGASIRFSEDHAFGEEWLFYLQVARSCRAGFVDEPLAIYHYQHGSLARTDKDANAQRYLQLLRSIVASFDDLERMHRQAVRRNLSRLCRQLGHSAHRKRSYGKAAVRFAESFRYKPNLRTLFEALESAVRCLWTVFSDLFRWNRGSQDASCAVR